MNEHVKRVVAIVSGLVVAVGVTFALQMAGLDRWLAAVLGGLAGFGDYAVIMFALSRNP